MCWFIFKIKGRNANWAVHLTEDTPAPWLRSAATPLVEFHILCSVCHAYYVKTNDVFVVSVSLCLYIIMSLCHCYLRYRPASMTSGWFESPRSWLCLCVFVLSEIQTCLDNLRVVWKTKIIVIVSLCLCVIWDTDLLQQPQGGLKVQDSCLSRSSKQHLIRQLSQQLHSVEVCHDIGWWWLHYFLWWIWWLGWWWFWPGQCSTPFQFSMCRPWR